MNAVKKKSPPFLAELRRRHVIRVGVAYAAVAFVVLQAADLILPALGFPPLALRLLVVFALLGFPVALVLAWALEITPQGFEAAGATVTGAAPESVEPKRARRVAVLPFTHISPSPDDEYFADGMTEEVISVLSRIRALDVIARTSIMRYKQQAKSVSEIGRELSAGTLVEGSVRKSGDRLRIAVQLIDASTEGHLWTETYDRELTDVFAIQSELALRISEALEAELTREERAALLDRADAVRTPDAQAYEAYLRGRFHWYKHTPQGLDGALQHFENAVALDPDYALAHGAIADTWGARTFLGLVAPRDAYPHVKAGVRRALELDDRIAENHDMMGRLRLWFEWDRKAAEQFSTSDRDQSQLRGRSCLLRVAADLPRAMGGSAPPGRSCPRDRSAQPVLPLVSRLRTVAPGSSRRRHRAVPRNAAAGSGSFAGSAGALDFPAPHAATRGSAPRGAALLRGIRRRGPRDRACSGLRACGVHRCHARGSSATRGTIP